MHAAQGIKRPELRDELYMQLLKQSRGNTTPSCAKVPPACSPASTPTCRPWPRQDLLDVLAVSA